MKINHLTNEDLKEEIMKIVKKNKDKEVRFELPLFQAFPVYRPTMRIEEYKEKIDKIVTIEPTEYIVPLELRVYINEYKPPERKKGLSL